MVHIFIFYAPFTVQNYNKNLTNASFFVKSRKKKVESTQKIAHTLSRTCDFFDNR